MIGRWTDHQLLMLLDVDSATAVAISNDISGRSFPLVMQSQEDGIAHQVALHVAMAVVHLVPGEDRRKFHARLKQMTGVTTG